MSFQLPSSFHENNVVLDKKLYEDMKFMDTRIVIRNLESLEEETSQDNSTISTKENFTILYFSINFIQKHLKKMEYKVYCEKLISFIKNYLPPISRTLINKFKQSTENIEATRVSFFLICYSIQATSYSQKNNIAKFTKQPTQNIELQTNIIEFHKQCIGIFRDLLGVLLYQSQEALYARYFSEALFKLLENKTLIKDQKCKDDIYQILLESIEKDPQGLMFMQSKVINLLYEDESLVQQLTEILIKINESQESRMKQIIIDIIRLVADFALNNTQATEQQSFKNLQKFFTLLSNRIPRVFNQNLILFMMFYNSDNYLLRNTLTQILTNILCYELNPQRINELDVETQDQHQIQRKKLLDVLFGRLNDKNAYARTFLLNQIKFLLDNNLVPAEVLVINFKIICQRIKDCSSLVRKVALKVIKGILIFFQQLYSDGGAFLTIQQINQLIQEKQEVLDDANKGLDELSTEMYNCGTDTQFDNLQNDKNMVQNEVIKQKFAINVLDQYRQFLQQIQELLPYLNQLLGSKSQSDVTKTLSLVSSLKKMNIEGVENSIKNMLGLVWHPDKQVQEKMLTKFYKLFLNHKEIGIDEAINNLVLILQSYSLKQHISIEKMLSIYSLQDDDKLTDKFYQNLWDRFQNLFKHDDQNVILLLWIVKVLYSNRAHLFDQQKTEVFAQILQRYKTSKINWDIVIRIVQLIRKIGQSNVVHSFFKHALYLVYTNFGTDDQKWYPACQEVLRMSSKISSPEEHFKYILIKATNKMTNQDDASFIDSQKTSELIQIQSAQLFFMVGEIAIRILVHIDDVSAQLKNLKAQADKIIDERKQEENDLDKIEGGIDAEYEYYQHKLVELTDQCKNLKQQIQVTINSPFMQVYSKIIIDTIKGMLSKINDENQEIKLNTHAEQMAALAFSKLLCLSEKFCEQYIELLFNLLCSSSCDSTIKNNLIIGFGDLLHRWPNTVTQYSNKVFQSVLTQEYTVKKTALNVLIHLVLNDMIKIRSEICHIGLVLSDEDKKSSQLAKVFFYEMNKKDQKILYNMIPEIIYKFSTEYTQEQFTKFIDQVVKYIEKDKNLESLTEKLLNRMKDKIELKEAINIAYTISQFSLKDTTFKMIIENGPSIRDFLKNEQIKQSFIKTSQRFQKRNLNNQEAKMLLEEFELFVLQGQERRRVDTTKIMRGSSKSRFQKSSPKDRSLDNVLGELDSLNYSRSLQD